MAVVRRSFYIMNELISRLSGIFKRKDNVGFFFRGSSFSFSINIVSNIVIYFLQIILARYLKVDKYGDFSYVMAILNLLLLVALLGFSASSWRYIAAYKANENWGLLKGFLQVSRKFVVIWSTIIATITAFIIILIKDSLSESLFYTFLTACLIIPVGTYASFLGEALVGAKRIVEGYVPNTIISPIIFIVVFITLIEIFNLEPTGASAMVSKLGGIICALFFIEYYFRKNFNKYIFNVKSEYNSKEWIRESFFLFVFSGMSVAMTQSNTVLTGSFLTSKDVGLYVAATRLSAMIMLILTAINAILGPLISDLYNSNKIKELQKILSLASLINFSVAFPAFVLFILFGKWFLALFGPEFVSGYSVLVITSFGFLAQTALGSVGLLMTMTKHQKQASTYILISLVFNITSSIILIPVYGVVGAAISFAFSSFLWKFLCFIFVVFKLKIDPTIIYLLRKYINAKA